MSRADRRTRRRLQRELTQTRNTVRLLQAELHFRHPLTGLGYRHHIIDIYLDQLRTLHLLSDPNRSRPLDPAATRKSADPPPPSLVPVWAARLLDQEIEDRVETIQHIASWIDKPKPISAKRTTRKRRCPDCRRQLNRNWAHCPRCGTQLDNPQPGRRCLNEDCDRRHHRRGPRAIYCDHCGKLLARAATTKVIETPTGV